MFKEVCCVVFYCVISNISIGSAFDIYDAEPLVRGSTQVNMTADELEDIMNIDPDGEYTMMQFQYEKDQYLGQYTNADERCYNDHVRCLTSVMAAARPVCGMDRKGVRSEFGSMCDLYLDNCKKEEVFWTIIDHGRCQRARNIFIYDSKGARWMTPRG